MTYAHTAPMGPPATDSSGGGIDYPFQGYREAWAGMRHAFEANHEVFVLTAPSGAGKTTLLANFLGEMANDETFIATAVATDLEGDSLFDQVLSQLDIPIWTPNSFAALEQVGERLNTCTHALLAIDDAHALTGPAFKDLLKLSYLRGARGPLLQVLLVGEDPVMASLEASELVQMNLWRAYGHRLAPLARPETGEFMQAWFERLAGDRKPSFTAESLDLVHRWSRGIPGRLVPLCHWFAHHGGDGRCDEFGLQEAREGIRGQAGLEAIEAHVSLPARFGEVVAGSVQRGESTEDNCHDAGGGSQHEVHGAGQTRDGAVSVVRPPPPKGDPPDDRPVIIEGGMSSSPEGAAPGSEESVAPAVAEPPPTGGTSWQVLAMARGFMPPRVQARLDDPRARRGAFAGLVVLGLVAAFQLGGYLSAPGATRADGQGAPLPIAADGEAVAAPEFPVPSPELPLTWLPREAGPEAPRDPGSAPAPLAAEAVPAVAESAAAAERAGHIENLLLQGGIALEKDYLLTPRDQSAWHYYQQVLQTDPDNAAAKLGMKLIVARYGELTRVVIARGDLDRAQVFIDRGKSVDPGEPALSRLQAEVDAARAERVAELQRQKALRDSEAQQVGEEERPMNPLRWLEELFGGNREEGES